MNLTTRPAYNQRVRLLASEGRVTWVSPRGFATVRMDNGLTFRTPWPMLRGVQDESSVVR